MDTTIALVGLSGAGKSTALKSLGQAIKFTHLVASDIIKAEMIRHSDDKPNSEHLRLGKTNDYQKFLIKGFLRISNETEGPIIIDAHTVIDKGDSLVPISTEVFSDLMITHMFYLRESPETIACRRKQDAKRTRPQLTIDRLRQHQRFSIETAVNICSKLDIPLTIISSANISILASVMK